jgi:hypothetical protein
MKKSRFIRRKIEISTSLHDFDVNERLDIEELNEENKLSKEEKIK